MIEKEMPIWSMFWICVLCCERRRPLMAIDGIWNILPHDQKKRGMHGKYMTHSWLTGNSLLLEPAIMTISFSNLKCFEWPQFIYPYPPVTLDSHVEVPRWYKVFSCSFGLFALLASSSGLSYCSSQSWSLVAKSNMSVGVVFAAMFQAFIGETGICV